MNNTKLHNHIMCLRDLGLLRLKAQTRAFGFTYEDLDYTFFLSSLPTRIEYNDGATYTIAKSSVIPRKASEIIGLHVITTVVKDNEAMLKYTSTPVNVDSLSLTPIPVEYLNTKDNSPYITTVTVDKERLKYFDIKTENNRVILTIKPEFEVGTRPDARRVLLHSTFEAPSTFHTSGNPVYVLQALNVLNRPVQDFKVDMVRKVKMIKQTLSEADEFVLERLDKMVKSIQGI